MTTTDGEQLTVVVIGRPTAGLVRALWGFGLRPVRGCPGPLVWRRPTVAEEVA